MNATAEARANLVKVAMANPVWKGRGLTAQRKKLPRNLPTKNMRKGRLRWVDGGQGSPNVASPREIIEVAVSRGTRGRGRGPRDPRGPQSRGPEAGPGVRPLPKGKKIAFYRNCAFLCM